MKILNTLDPTGDIELTSSLISNHKTKELDHMVEQVKSSIFNSNSTTEAYQCLQHDRL